MQLCSFFEHSLSLPFFGIGVKTDLFQSCGHCWVLVGLISSVQSLSHVGLFATPWTTARPASLPITNSRSLPKLMSIESVMPSSLIVTSKRTYIKGTSQDGCCQCSCPTAGRCWPMPLQETLKHSQSGLAQSPVGVTAPFPSVMMCTSFVCTPQESLFPQSYASSVSKSSLAFKVQFPWDSQVSGGSQGLWRCYIIELAPLGQATCRPSAQLLGWGKKIN